MTFKDLKKFVEENNGNSINNNHQSKEELKLQSSERFAGFRDLPFWIDDIKSHKQRDVEKKGNCCFNHIIGLPRKDGIVKPIFDYEKLLYNSLLVNDYSNILNHNFKHKHLFVKKSTGLGVTEFFLRLMAWLCLRDNDYQNSQMCIVTGPNIDIAIKLIKRMKGLFEPKLGAYNLYFLKL